MVFCRFKSDRCGIETKWAHSIKDQDMRSNQTVAGLKLSVRGHRYGWPRLVQIRPLRDWNSIIIYDKASYFAFKSDRCGIETIYPFCCVISFIAVQIRPLRDWNYLSLLLCDFFHCCSNQTVAGLKHAIVMPVLSAMIGSNQTVAGLKPNSWVNGVSVHASSNQTVAGLKHSSICCVMHLDTRSNQTVAGLKLQLFHCTSILVRTVQIRPLRDWNGDTSSRLWCSLSVQIRPLRDWNVGGTAISV